jgi:hypothetical protein
MEARARNREELGLPGEEGGLSTLIGQIPGIGLAKTIAERVDAKERMANPELLHNTAGTALGTNLQRGGPMDKFGNPANVQMLSEGGQVEAAEEADAKDPAEIPDDIREYVEKAHKQIRESRPDEGWRIKSADREDSVAPYKREEEETASEDHGEGDSTSGMPHYDEGGTVGDQPFDPNAILREIAPPGTGMIAPSPAAPVASAAPVAPPPVPAAAVPKPPMPSAPGLTDQDFMDRANKMLGLGPEEQAGFMKLLGNNAQKSQIGAGIAGIGDAIAAGGTLGKVNPGALKNSEDIIQNKTKQGLEGMQTIRGNQEKAFETADKLEARDPKSPLSKYAQKAYAGVGKKIGIDLSNASAALIADVTGKGVEALNTEYQGQLKQMGLQLQKAQVDATIANQKAERDIAREGHQADAAKTLADRGILKTVANAIPGTAGHKATQILEKQAMGNTGPVSVNSHAEYNALPSGTHYVDSFGTEKVKK